MILANLPILIVILPLIAAPLVVLIGRGAWAWPIAAVASWSTLIMASTLLLSVLNAGVISYHLGSFAPPIGIEIRIDEVNAFILLVITLIAAATILFARDSVAKEIEPQQITPFYALYLLCLTGLIGIAATGDAFNLYVFLEISALSSYALIAMGRDRRALSAAYNYLILGTIGATLYVVGVGLLYMMTGTLNLVDLQQRLPSLMDKTTVIAAFGLILVGLSLKIALFPLHLWLPNAYQQAPSFVSVFLAATSTKVGVYVMLRVLVSLFGLALLADSNLDIALAFSAVIAMFMGSTVAVFQIDFKRLLAYSSVAQVGYMVLGISLGTPTGITATIVHLLNHALIKGGLFMAAGCLVYRLGSAKIEDLDGLAKRNPELAAAITLGGLGLIGVPLTAGFVSKWYLILAALESEHWYMALAVAGSSLIAVIYVWRLVERMYFRPAIDTTPLVAAPIMMRMAMWLALGASVYFGLDTRYSVSVAEAASLALLGIVE